MYDNDQNARKTPWKRFAVLGENGEEVGALQLRTDAYDYTEPTVDTNDIKYELIDIIKSKAKDLIIFNRYIYNGKKIDADIILRISYAGSFRDFVIPRTAIQATLNALKRAVYRIEKVNKANRVCQNSEKLYNFFLGVQGETLSEIIEKSNFDKLQTKK